jgi:hypothetical protein
MGKNHVDFDIQLAIMDALDAQNVDLERQKAELEALIAAGKGDADAQMGLLKLETDITANLMEQLDIANSLRDGYVCGANKEDDDEDKAGEKEHAEFLADEAAHDEYVKWRDGPPDEISNEALILAILANPLVANPEAEAELAEIDMQRASRPLVAGAKPRRVALRGYMIDIPNPRVFDQEPDDMEIIAARIMANPLAENLAIEAEAKALCTPDGQAATRSFLEGRGLLPTLSKAEVKKAHVHGVVTKSRGEPTDIIPCGMEDPA